MTPVVSYDPAAPQAAHGWGHITWQVTGQSADVSSMTIGRVCIEAGHENPRHRHNRCDEVLILISGELVHTMGDREYPMVAGDTISIPAGIFHNARNPGSVPADMIVCFSSGDRDFELESP